eukprot:475868-Pyramimonas_sp.AAC.1
MAARQAPAMCPQPTLSTRSQPETGAKRPPESWTNCLLAPISASATGFLAEISKATAPCNSA